MMPRTRPARIHATDARQPPIDPMPPDTPLAASHSLPASAADCVRRTAESIVLGDTPADDRYGA